MSSTSDIIKALLTRIIFASHIIVAVWWVVQVTHHEKLWHLAFFDGLLCLETLFSLCFRRGQEFKWFSPSIFCHLAAIIPCAWILEFHLLEARKNGTSVELRNPSLDLSAERWSDLIEQTTMLMMILGRWLLPTAQGMSKDSLSQLLLVNLAMCADIIEFFDLLKLDFVRQSQKLIITILVLWTWSLMQFPFNTMSKFDDDEERKSPTNTNRVKIGRGTIVPFENAPIHSKTRVSMTSLDFRQALASKRISRDILLMSHNYSRGLPRDYLPDFRRDSYQPYLVEASNTVLENNCSSEVSQFNNNTETQTITGSDQTRGPGRFSLDVGQMRPKRPTGRMTSSKTSPNLMLDDCGHTPLDQVRPSSVPGSDPTSKAETTEEWNHAKKSRIDSELVVILMSLFMQDGPFLTFRLFVISRYQAYEYMIIFLTAKNALVLMLQVYRLCVLHCTCYDHMENDFSPDNIIDANARLKNVQVAIAHYEKKDLGEESHNDRILRRSSLRNQFSYSSDLNRSAQLPQ